MTNTLLVDVDVSMLRQRDVERTSSTCTTATSRSTRTGATTWRPGDEAYTRSDATAVRPKFFGPYFVAVGRRP